MFVCDDSSLVLCSTVFRVVGRNGMGRESISNQCMQSVVRDPSTRIRDLSHLLLC